MSNDERNLSGDQPQPNGDYSSDQVEREISVTAAKAAAEAARRRAKEAIAAAAEQSRGEKLTIKTNSGWVHGRLEDVDGKFIRSWRGIPFGADTSGPNRFRAPQPVEPWEGIRYCNEFGPVAPQPTYSWHDRIIGSEDCLHLDVVRPDTDEELPVVVYFHGGSFIVGSSHMLMLRGFQLAEAMNVVYVSINFRLGALGYLDLRSLSDDCVANPAVMDQLLALQWVQDNISAFGGDPNSVTAMGESAGGAAVLTLMASPAAKGLFHRAIAQSSPVGMIHSRTQSTWWARELVKRMALPRGSTVDALREAEGADIVRAGQSMMWRNGEILHLNSSYSPTVDEDLIPDHPLEVFARGEQMDIPLLIGTNSDEASFSKFVFQREHIRQRAALRLLASYDEDNAPGVVEAYGGAANRSEFAELLADALFWAPSIRVAQSHALKNSTWMYRFSYASKALRALGLGAMHSMELSNVFGDLSASRASLLLKMGSSEEMEELTVVMQRHWANFIHFGRPGDDWPIYTTSASDAKENKHPAPDAERHGLALQGKPPVRRATMVFDVPHTVVYDPRRERRKAWNDYNMLEWGLGRPDILAEIEFLIEGLSP